MLRLDTLKRLVEEDPKDEFSRYALALEYNSVGERDKALSQFLELKSSSPEYLALYYQLGKLYEDTGDTNTAARIYEEGILLAEKQNDSFTKSELQEALDNILI